MPTPRSSHFLIALFAVLASACGDSVAPGELGEEYTLISVGGDVLPTGLITTEFGTLLVVSQNIRFGPKGAGSITQATELVPPGEDASEASPTPVTSGLNWTEVDGRVEIEFDCPSITDCAPRPHLVADIDQHGLTARWGPGMNGRTPLRYEKVRAFH